MVKTHKEIFAKKIRKFNRFYEKVQNFLKISYKIQDISDIKAIFLLGRIALNIAEYSVH